jgi:serine/threonine-protein kinase
MSSPSADRNLIFGLLALRTNFVTRGQFLDSMHAWMREKQTSLGEILCRRGVLDLRDREDLDRLADRHIERHGGDTQASVAVLRVEKDVPQEILQLADADVQTSLSVSVAESCVSTTATSAAGLGTPALRFRKVREHATEGMGDVFVALDAELNREVALKEMQERYADLPDARLRFLREAEITGKLEHPRIVPIYGLGCYAVRPRWPNWDVVSRDLLCYHKAAVPRSIT